MTKTEETRLDERLRALEAALRARAALRRHNALLAERVKRLH
jgi:hypothetical protein